MTRKDFLGTIMEIVFGVKHIDLKELDYKECKQAVFIKSGTKLNDCTFTKRSGQSFCDMFNHILSVESIKIVNASETESKEYAKDDIARKCMQVVSQYIFSDDSLPQIEPNYLELPIEKIRHIYLEIIFRELFNLSDGKKGGGDFSEGAIYIQSKISDYLSPVQADMVKTEKEFRESIPERLLLIREENAELFDDLKIDLSDKRIAEDVIEAFADIDFRYDYRADLEKIIEWRDKAEDFSNSLSSFSDSKKHNKNDFGYLTEFCMNLLAASDYYFHDFDLDDVRKYKNTAFRIYREFYGKGHREIDFKAMPEWYGAHAYLLEYVIRLNNIVLQKEQKEQD